MSTSVVVVDYGLGNLFSVRKALEHCGAQVNVTDDPEAIARAGRLVLPGVGAFKDGMMGLREKSLIEPVRAVARSGNPLLGVCLGMQMLMTSSEEFGEHAGLDLIPGKVKAIPATTAEGGPHRVPHIGWAPLQVPASNRSWQGTILRETPVGAAVYLVHSFTAWPADDVHRLADCDYDGRLISAAVQSENIYGCQFHPEKSAQTGLTMLKCFLSL